MNNIETDALSECLEKILSGQSSVEDCLMWYPEYREEFRPVLQTAVELMQGREIEPSILFHRQAREHLLQVLPVHRLTENRRKQSTPLLWNLIGQSFRIPRAVSLAIGVLLICILIGTGTVYASAPALPGDILYPVKRSVEDLQISLSTQDAKIALGVQFMHEREKEIYRLVALERYEDLSVVLHDLEDLSINTVHRYGENNMTHQPNADQQGVLLDGAIDQNIISLRKVLDQVPDQAKPAIEHALAMSQHANDIVDKSLHGNGHKDNEEPTEATSMTPRGVVHSTSSTTLQPSITKVPPGQAMQTIEPSMPTSNPGQDNKGSTQGNKPTKERPNKPGNTPGPPNK